MCRFIAYLGDPTIIENLVLKPSNSLLMQSIEAKEADIRTNGDGFGIGWYAPEIDNHPGLYTSILPAWNDLNLISLCQKIKTPCFFAHVRAANQGEVTQLNCHPFIHQDLMFMHNGLVGNFDAIKRDIQNHLDDGVFSILKGSTDSEHIFALILQHLKNKPRPLSTNSMALSIRETIKLLLELSEQHGTESSFLNVCLSDGKKMVGCRYTNDQHDPARSLYYAKRQTEKGQEIKEKIPNFVMITSEKLTDGDVTWHPITNAEIVLVEENHQVHFEPLYS